MNSSARELQAALTISKDNLHRMKQDLDLLEENTPDDCGYLVERFKDYHEYLIEAVDFYLRTLPRNISLTNTSEANENPAGGRRKKKTRRLRK